MNRFGSSGTTKILVYAKNYLLRKRRVGSFKKFFLVTDPSRERPTDVTESIVVGISKTVLVSYLNKV
jgi:hypothetical protein